MKSMNEYIFWYQLWAPLDPFSNYIKFNPIFAVNVVKTSQESWFDFTKQVSFWMRDDSLWANGAKVWVFQGPFGAISCSWNLLNPSARSLWSTVACRWIPSSPFKTSMLWTGPAKPWPRYQRHPKIIILGHGKGDSRQISAIQNVNSLLSAAGVAPSIFFEILQSQCLTRTWVLTCLALGEPSLQLATCHSQTNPPSMNKWLSTLRHPAQAPRCSHQEVCINGVPSGVDATRLQMYRSCFLLEFISILWHLSHCEDIAIYWAHSFRRGSSIAFVPHSVFAGTRYTADSGDL